MRQTYGNKASIVRNDAIKQHSLGVHHTGSPTSNWDWCSAITCLKIHQGGSPKSLRLMLPCSTPWEHTMEVQLVLMQLCNTLWEHSTQKGQHYIQNDTVPSIPLEHIKEEAQHLNGTDTAPQHALGTHHRWKLASHSMKSCHTTVTLWMVPSLLLNKEP